MVLKGEYLANLDILTSAELTKNHKHSYELECIIELKEILKQFEARIKKIEETLGIKSQVQP